MKLYSCPDCKVTQDSCEGCQRYQANTPPSNITPLKPWSWEEILKDYNISSFGYKCCENCPNSPKNGGSGICNCVLPYFENPFVYTGIDTSLTYDMHTTTENGE